MQQKLCFFNIFERFLMKINDEILKLLRRATEALEILANNKEGGIVLKSGNKGINISTSGQILLKSTSTDPESIRQPVPNTTPLRRTALARMQHFAPTCTPPSITAPGSTLQFGPS